jgi:hypothetical protein
MTRGGSRTTLSRLSLMRGRSSRDIECRSPSGRLVANTVG